MIDYPSPLRYPGGKAVLANVLGRVIALNNMQDCIYAEPYAGGAGAALALLFGEHVSKVLINDADPCVYAFWHAVLNQPTKFIDLVEETPVTMNVWKAQREVYRNHSRYSQL